MCVYCFLLSYNILLSIYLRFIWIFVFILQVTAPDHLEKSLNITVIKNQIQYLDVSLEETPDKKYPPKYLSYDELTTELKKISNSHRNITCLKRYLFYLFLLFQWSALLRQAHTLFKSQTNENCYGKSTHPLLEKIYFPLCKENFWLS